MYSNFFSSRHPVLVDQSCSMENTVSGKDYNLAQMVSDAINAIFNMFQYHNCRINADGEEEIKKTTFFCIIGYGADWNNVEILFADWISEICEPCSTVRNLLKTELKSKWNNDADFVEVYKPSINGGMTPMASAFSLAKEVVEDWIRNHNEDNSPAPCVLNITDGFCTDDESELISSARDIMSIETPEGNPVIFNLHISALPDTTKAEFPKSVQLCSNVLYKLLFDSSSTITQDLAEDIHLLSERDMDEKEKLFVYNIDNVEDLYRYLHFALEFSFHHYKILQP